MSLTPDDSEIRVVPDEQRASWVTDHSMAWDKAEVEAANARAAARRAAATCPTCNIPQAEHTEEMAANCAVFDISADAVPRISEAETAPASAHPSPGTPPGAGASISVASVLLGWCNDIKRELEEFANDGPVGPMVPYRPDRNARKEDLAALLDSLSDLIRALFDLRHEVGNAVDEGVYS